MEAGQETHNDDASSASQRSDERQPLLADSSRTPAPESESGIPESTDVSELWWLFQNAVPLIFTYLLQYSHAVITTYAAGHLGADDLAATAIGLTTMNIIGYAIFEGMASALDTLCSQAYGSGNHTCVGLHVQRMLFLMALTSLPVGAVYVCSPWILPLFGLAGEPELVAQAAVFLRVSLLGLPGYAAFEALKRFLQAQGDCNAALAVVIACTPLNALLTWLFAFRLGLGLAGAALGPALANNLRPVLLLAYIASPAGRWSRACWAGLGPTTRDACDWRKWGPMVRLAAAGTVVNLGEWLAFEILTFSTTYLGTEYLAAQTVLNTTSVLTWHVSFAISIAVSTRLGQLVGAGRLAVARRATALYTAVFVVVGLLNGALLLGPRDAIARFFAADPAVRRVAAGAMGSVAAFQLVDALGCLCNGVLRGLGRQTAAAWVVFPVNYAAAVPLALWLELGGPDLRVDGLWIGMGVGVLLIALLEAVYMKWLDWRTCVERVKSREE